MKVKRHASGMTWEPGYGIRCDACNESRRESIRLDTEPSYRGVVNLCMACARHVAKAVSALTKGSAK